ncbi:MAG TPA: heavy metal-associated domain-containing protein [archaeon]|nr:heavy metal-associated domain-containing protein [archaeon]
MEKTIKVLGMHCNSCNLLIEDAICEIKGVEAVNANFQTGKVTVKYNDENLMPKIKQAIEKEGYHVQ